MKCGQPATHKFTKIDKGQIYDIFLCAEHAAEMSPYQKPKVPLSDILEGLLKQETKQKTSGPVAPSSLRCQTCGLPFEAYKKNLLLGCSDCYGSFREYLIPDLRRFHGDTRHYGRQPGGGHTQPPERAQPLFDVEAESAGLVGEGESPQATVVHFEPADPKRLIEELTQTMRKAIQNEDYVKAAHCRDQIHELKSKLKTKPSGG
jgi:protein arginine kinase activator